MFNLQYLGTTNNNTEDSDQRPTEKVHAVVVCTGLSTRFLGGVEDSTMHPLRGQVIILRAPWVKVGMTEFGAVDENGEEKLTYIIPRRTGEVSYFFPLLFVAFEVFCG